MRLRAFLVAGVCGFGGVVLAHGSAAAASRLSVCIDTASVTASRDQALAEQVAAKEGVALDVAHFDSSDDDDGVTGKEFKKLLATRCDLVLGYPVDLSAGFAMPDIMQTKAYDQTGFVLVVPAGSPAKDLADLPKGTKVAVTFETAPNLYFLSHPSLTPDVHTTDGDTLKAVADGSVAAAMVWQPTVRSYLAAAPAAKLSFYPLQEPHARYDVVALYTARGADEAKRFNDVLESLSPAGFDHAAVHKQSSSGFDPGMIRRENAGGFDPAMVYRTAVTAGSDALPALYTDSQAAAGAAKFAANCQVCHGAQLQGLVGPALKGPNFASVKSAFAVSDIFMIVSQNMPASNPGSLAKDDYVQIMAFLLQQNGYPAGGIALTYDGATNSNVPLVYHGH